MCNQVDTHIRTWERTGRLSHGELALVTEHVGQCRRCALAYGSLIPFLRRGAGQPSGLLATPGQLSERFTERIMERIVGKNPVGRFASARRRHPTTRLPIALAASAALLIAAGFLVWLWGYRTRGDEVLVRFELVAPEARGVTLVGDFNGWDPHRLAMKDATGDGDWQITIWLKKGREYTYNFLMDGRRWIADPSSSRQVDDGFGGMSSVLEL